MKGKGGSKAAKGKGVQHSSSGGETRGGNERASRKSHGSADASGQPSTCMILHLPFMYVLTEHNSSFTVS